MPSKDAILKQVMAALESERGINLHSSPIQVSVEGDVLTMEGEVGNIAAKKLALEVAARTGGVRGIVDRLRVTPAEHRGDGAVLDAIVAAFQQQIDFRNCTLRVIDKGRVDTLHEALGADPCGDVTVSVKDGVITLDGHMISLSHKRIAGVLAWWTPGRRDVVNGLGVEPPENDNDDEVADALRLVLELDPQVDPDQIRVTSRDCVVTLDGFVRTAREKQLAELDAWYLFGVDKVVNNLNVQD
jgi:osmotically-inducible protein OsmY